MFSMMWNGYFIYIKVKSRGEQSAANTELAGLCFSFIWKARLSPGRSNTEHLIALCGINNFFSSNRLRLNTVASLFYHHKNYSSTAFGSVHSVTGVVSWCLTLTNHFLCSNWTQSWEAGWLTWLTLMLKAAQAVEKVSRLQRFALQIFNILEAALKPTPWAVWQPGATKRRALPLLECIAPYEDSNYRLVTFTALRARSLHCKQFLKHVSLTLFSKLLFLQVIIT